AERAARRARPHANPAVRARARGVLRRGAPESRGTMTNRMPIGTRVWSLGKLLLLVGALAATFGLFALIGMRAALRAQQVEVPELVGMTVSDASRHLGELGLTLRTDPNQRPDERVPAGSIMQQDPP